MHSYTPPFPPSTTPDAAALLITSASPRAHPTAVAGPSSGAPSAPVGIHHPHSAAGTSLPPAFETPDSDSEDRRARTRSNRHVDSTDVVCNPYADVQLGNHSADSAERLLVEIGPLAVRTAGTAAAVVVVLVAGPQTPDARSSCTLGLDHQRASPGSHVATDTTLASHLAIRVVVLDMAAVGSRGYLR